MAIPNTSLSNSASTTGTKLAATLFADLNKLIANDVALDLTASDINTKTTAVNNACTGAKFLNNCASCAGTCTSNCTGTCITTCTGACYFQCTTGCKSCAGCSGSCTSCRGCSGGCAIK